MVCITAIMEKLLRWFIYQWRLSSKFSLLFLKRAVMITSKVLQNSEGEAGVLASTLGGLNIAFHAYVPKA